MDHLALDHHMLQDEEEFEGFCKLMQKQGARSYLEIGSWSGGSIEMAAKYLPQGSRIVSIEMPVSPVKYAKLQQVMGGLVRDGYSAFLCTADSAHGLPIRLARELGPYDAVFIDGDHTFEGVESDWEHYGKLGKIIGFHDVAIDKPPQGVARFWKQLKTKYRHVEFISEETRQQDIGYGIGVVFRDEPTRGENDGSDGATRPDRRAGRTR